MEMGAEIKQIILKNYISRQNFPQKDHEACSRVKMVYFALCSHSLVYPGTLLGCIKVLTQLVATEADAEEVDVEDKGVEEFYVLGQGVCRGGLKIMTSIENEP